MSTAATIRWLKLASFVLAILGGLILALGACPPLSEGARLFADLAIWPFDGTQTLAAAETRLFAAIGGGALVGFGVMIWMLASHGYEQAPELTRTIILSGVGGWFVTDSLGSIAAGAPANALFNVPLMLAFVIPLVRRRADQALTPPPSQ